MATAAAVVITNPLADLWGSFGIEVLIFAVTFGFAFLIRRSSSTRQATKPKKKKVQDHDQASLASGEHSQSVTPSPPPRVSRPGRAVTNVRAEKKNAWEIVNDIVEGMKEHQGMKFVHRVLFMYEELKADLEIDRRSLPQITRLSRHSAVEFYTVLVQCAIRVGKYQLVDYYIEDMKQYGVHRPLVFYESAMKQFAAQKQFQLALSIFDHLEADGLEPSAVTCSCLVGFAVEAGEHQRALFFFDKLCAKTTPSIRAYMTILRVHGKRGDWTSSLAVLRDMQRREVAPDGLVLNTVLATGISANQLAGVTALLEEAEQQVPPLPDVVSYNTLIKGCAQQSNADGAMHALSRMRSRGLKPNAISFNTAMDAAVRAGRLKDAWRVLEDMRTARLRPDKFSCSILVKGIAQSPDAKNIEAGQQLLQEAGAACDTALLSSMYNTLLEAASQAADPTVVAKVYTQMSQQGIAALPNAQKLLVKLLPSSSAAHR